MATEILRRRFTIEEYHRMAETGILGHDDRVELIDGEIVEMSPIASRHSACVARLTHVFFKVVGSRALVWSQAPCVLPPYSEPEPDIMLLRPRADFYEQAHPRPADILLVVEVSDSSLDYDRGVKLRLYARAGIPEAWIVDVAGEVVEVHREPAATGYRDVRRARRGAATSSRRARSLTS